MVYTSFRKGETNWKWEHLLYLATRDIAAVIPPEQAFILVGKELLETEITARYRVIPFLERDGEYWGQPPDDDTAISELERLRCFHAGFVVFPWTAFWWLEKYPGLQKHLRLRYRSVLKNERVLVFDLRPLTRIISVGS
jgi:hypothetical protein